jgi:hypothetical protein
MWQLPFALVVSVPVAALVGSTYGRGADGDAVLWAPGGRALLSFAAQQAAALRAMGALAATVWISWAFVGMVPMAMVMVAMSFTVTKAMGPVQTPPLGVCQSLGLRMWPRFVKLLLVFAAAQGTLLGLGGGLALATAMWTHAILGEALSQQLALCIALPFVFAAFAVHVIHDLARAFVVFSGRRAFAAIDAAVRSFRCGPVGLGAAWAWRASLASAAVLVGALSARRSDGLGGVALALLALGDQVIVLVRASLRASWLARALRAAAEEPTPLHHET